MLKKLISLCLIFAMVMAISPAVMAEEEAPRPTVEEILSEYHQKAFAAEYAEANDTVSTYALRSGSSGKTLEEETVETLNAAGYEAYNVTSANYKELETQLHTDFAEMGLDPNSSYIVTISGEDDEDTSSTYAVGDNLFFPELPPDVGGSSSQFLYTYNGTTYRMRYVTVTAATDQNPKLGASTPIDIIARYGSDNLLEKLSVPISVLTSLGLLPVGVDKLCDLCTFLDSRISDHQEQSLVYTGASNWTVTYTQIFNTDEATWKRCGSIEYVTMRYFINYTYYDPDNNQYEQESADGTLATQYSSLYNDKETMKEYAALAYENNTSWYDKISYVTYKFGDDTVITHSRWSEYAEYEPA